MLILYNPVSTSPGKTVMPMSLLSLGAVLEGKYPYQIVDGNLINNHADTLIELLKSNRAAALGITVMAGPQLNQAVPLVKKIKANLPHLPIIWGGYFATQHTEAVLNSGYVDYVVRGQGELTLLELLDTLQNGGDLAAISGLSYRDGEQIVDNPTRPLASLEQFPILPYHRVDMSRYLQNNYISSRAIDYNSSFGCPFYCSFCAIVSMTNRGWMPESPQRMATTLGMLRDTYGINGV